MSLDRRLLIASGLALSAGSSVARARSLPPAPGDMVLGAATAPVQFVVYASASCGHCAHWWTTELPAIRKTYIDTGKVRLVFREFLTPPNEFAAAGFLLARRVPGKYFDVLTTVFQKQDAIYQSGRLWEGLLEIGRQYRLTEAQFTAAMNDDKALDGVNTRFRRAIAQDQVEVTPTFFVNGAPYEGEADIAALSRIFALAAKG